MGKNRKSKNKNITKIPFKVPEIGDQITITDRNHPYFGKKAYINSELIHVGDGYDPLDIAIKIQIDISCIDFDPQKYQYLLENQKLKDLINEVNEDNKLKGKNTNYTLEITDFDWYIAQQELAIFTVPISYIFNKSTKGFGTLAKIKVPPTPIFNIPDKNITVSQIPVPSYMEEDENGKVDRINWDKRGRLANKNTVEEIIKAMLLMCETKNVPSLPTPNSILDGITPNDVLILSDGTFWVDTDWKLLDAVLVEIVEKNGEKRS